MLNEDRSVYMNDIIQIIKTNFMYNYNTGNQLVDMLMTSLLIFMITYFVNNIRFISIKRLHSNSGIFNFIYSMIYKCNTLEFDGKRTIKSTNWSTITENLFSNRFRAIWHYISKIENNDNIYSLKELSDNENIYEDPYGERDKDMNKFCNSDGKNSDLYIVNQTKPFQIVHNIYCIVNIFEKDMESSTGSSKNNTIVEIINVKIFSYTKTIDELKEFCNHITDRYINEVYNKRKDKKFIYSLRKFDRDSDSTLAKWDECEFISNKTFENGMFFEQKSELMQKLNFFINNREWYKKHGIPYSLGIGLHGPPGTGKTSIIKCIANKLNRHLIVISLNKINSAQEFSDCYYENTFNEKNKRNSIIFDKKIIVLEDIDCMSDIVQQRTGVNVNKNTTENMLTNIITGLNNHKNGNNGNNGNGNNGNNENNRNINNIFKTMNTNKDKLTLSDLLNIIDGIRETPGRILIITSNHYHKLDKALTRPGRIDVSLELKNATKKTVNEIFNYYYNTNLPRNIFNKLSDYQFSPAKINNIRFLSNTKSEFLKNLDKEIK